MEANAKATYNITDNRLKLWIDRRLTDEEYKEAKGHAFQWWPGRKCFSAVWNPGAEDFVKRFVEVIDEDDTPDDIEGRVERFKGYAERDERDAQSAAQRAIEASTKRRAEAAEGTAAKKANEALYWQRRIAGAIGRAEYRDRPDVIERRIKGFEAEHRKHERAIDQIAKWESIWKNPAVIEKEGYARKVAGSDPNYFSMRFTLAEYPRTVHTYEGDMSIYSALEDIITPAQAQALILEAYAKMIAYHTRWIEHLDLILEYQRAYFQAAGGVETVKEKKPRRVTKRPENDPFSVGAKVAYFMSPKKLCGEVVKVNAKTIEVTYQYSGSTYNRKMDRRELVLFRES